MITNGKAIEDLLQNEDNSARIQLDGNCWIVWDDTISKWILYRRSYQQQFKRELIRHYDITKVLDVWTK